MKRTLLYGILLLPFLVSAGIVVNPDDTTVTPGVWCGNFHSATNFAIQNDMALVLVWGKVGCMFCTNVRNALGTDEGLSWAANLQAANGEKVVFCIVEGDSGFKDLAPNIGAKEFAKGTSTTTPYIRLEWPGRGTTYFSGSKLSPQSDDRELGGDDLRALLAQFEERVETFLAGIDLSATMVGFPFGDYEHDRLEAIVGKTEWVDVPLVRTNMLETTETMSLAFSCGGSVRETNLVWEAGEDRKFVRYALPPAFESAKTVEIVLKSDSGMPAATRHITGLDEVENSTKNPLWIGETIDYGQWTMDIGAVTNLVAAKGGHALVLLAGSCWCPDCAMTDKYFFDDPRFVQWAQKKSVALGVVDIPNDPTALTNFPSLLTYDSYRTSDSYVTMRGHAATNEMLRYQSGAGYLSRNSIDWDEAVEVIQRNRDLCSRDTLNGGWNRPERANKARPGVPILVLLRADGSIAGRWNPFASTAPTEFSEGYLRRFEELFDQVDDLDEERNDDKSTTEAAVTATDSVSSTLSAADAQDVYRIDADIYTRMVFTLSGKDAVPFTLTLTDDAEAISKTLVVATNLLSETICVTAKVSSAKCHVKVAYDGSGVYTNLESTVHGYRLSTEGTMSGGEIGFAASTQTIYEDCEGPSKVVDIKVVRTGGSKGTASALVSLTEGLEAIGQGRIAWTNQTVSWADGASGERSVSLTVYDDDEPMKDLPLVFVLSDLKAAAADTVINPSASELHACLYDDDVFGELAYRNVSYSEVQAIEGWQEGAAVSVSRLSGTLPSGFSVRIAGEQLVVSGCPTRSGQYASVYRVRVVKDGAIVKEYEVEFEYTVRDMDFAAVIPSLAAYRTYRNLPVVADGGVSGLLTLTVPESGRLSAKYKCDSGTYSYSARGWAGFEEGLNPVLTAGLTRVGDADDVMSVRLAADGGRVEFTDPANGAAAIVHLPVAAWSAGHPADVWSGQYTVQLPQAEMTDGADAPRLTGSAYLAMRMLTSAAKNRGAMLYAGVLPNGQTLSGTSVLLEEPTFARMPFYHRFDGQASSGAFSGEFIVAPNAKATYKSTDKMMRWSVSNSVSVCWSVADGYGHAGTFAVYGGYYDKDEISETFAADMNHVVDNIAFHVDAASLVSGRYGIGTVVDFIPAQLLENIPSLVPTAGNPQDVTLSFSPLTGVIYGTLYLPFDQNEVAVTYRGIALPGWQSCGTCAEFIERPWAAGSCSFSDRDGEFGVFRSGCEVKLDRKERGYAE